jgi:hypothetical protein
MMIIATLFNRKVNLQKIEFILQENSSDEWEGTKEEEVLIFVHCDDRKKLMKI